MQFVFVSLFIWVHAVSAQEVVVPEAYTTTYGSIGSHIYGYASTHARILAGPFGFPYTTQPRFHSGVNRPPQPYTVLL